MRCALAPFGHGFREEGDVLLNHVGLHLVRLGEDQGEGDAAVDQPADEFLIDLLGRVTGVDQDEGAAEVRALAKVIGDELVEAVAIGARGLGVTVARKVDEAPRLVDGEEVNLAGTAGLARDPGERRLPGEKVEERRLADVGAPDEGELRELRLRTAVEADSPKLEYGRLDFHGRRKFYIMEQAVRPSHPTITPRPLEATPSDALSPWPKSSPRIPGRAQNARRPLRRSG